MLHQISPAATSGPKACCSSEPARSPRNASSVARVRKQVGQGMAVSARSGQLQPGRWE